jgi:hypothetical protein
MIWLLTFVPVQAAFFTSSTRLASCSSGTFRQPDNYNCFDYCPTGYTADAATSTCTGTQQEVLRYTFNTPKASVVDSASSIPLDTTGSSAPYSVLNGGKYFNGALYMQMPGASSVRLGSSFAMTFWVSMSSSTTNIMSFFSKKVSPRQNSRYNDDMTFALSKTYFYFAAQSYSLYWLYSDPIPFTKWNKVHITLTSNAPNTELKFYINNVSDALTMTNKYFYEDSTTVNWLGRRQSSAVSYNQWFYGMIYEFVVYNFAAPYVRSSSASLTLCKSNQFDVSGVCTDCVNCVTCVRTTDCNLCADSMCSACNDFSIGTCTQCIAGATLNSGVCACPSGQYKINNSCSSKDYSACPASCSSCQVDVGCVGCSSGYAKINGVCVGKAYAACDTNCLKCEASGCTQCPIGYSPRAEKCSNCDVSCRTCSGPSNAECLTCTDTGVTPDKGVCKSCYSTCQACTGTSSTQCTVCKDSNMDLKNGSCTCHDGYYWDGTACNDCHTS